MKAIHAINAYFFDVESTDGETDWLSATLFYGVVGLCIVMGVVFIALNLAW